MEYTVDSFIWTDDVKILTAEELCVPGLEMFGHNCAAGNLRALVPHIHKNMEFLYLANGTQVYHIHDREYLLKGNQVLAVDGDVLHSSGENPFGRHESLWFRLDIGAFTEGLGVPAEMRQKILLRLKSFPSPVITLRENLYGELQGAFYAMASQDPAGQLRGYAGFVNFIAQLICSADPGNAYSPNIQQVIAYIDAHICRRLDLEELAELAGLSLSGFKQKFRREIGITPREYVNLKKVEKAREYLAAGYSVTETAFALDFSSSSYFSVLFRQIEDMPPSTYGALHKQKR